jgi:hypothetical protein
MRVATALGARVTIEITPQDQQLDA